VANYRAHRASGLAKRPAGHGLRLAREGAMTEVKSLIAVRHLSREGRQIPVLLFRNAGGSVAGQCLLDLDDAPIVDAPTATAVIALLEQVIDDLIDARRGATKT
jgi:hypothetical protein